MAPERHWQRLIALRRAMQKSRPEHERLCSISQTLIKLIKHGGKVKVEILNAISAADF
jgi:hypothetical protein